MELKINLGCGTIVAPGWINYDISLKIWLLKHKSIKRLLFALKLISEKDFKKEIPPNITRRDLRKGIPLPTNSVQYIYTSHFLEHLSRKDVVRVLRECYRVLKPGGWMRIVVPDLRLLAEKYVKKEINADEFLKRLNLIDDRPLFQRLLFPHSCHRYMFDFDSLKALLLSCGFRAVERRAFRKGVVPDLDLLDNREEESLFVEALK